jgi:hypothetical protein
VEQEHHIQLSILTAVHVRSHLAFRLSWFPWRSFLDLIYVRMALRVLIYDANNANNGSSAQSRLDYIITTH